VVYPRVGATEDAERIEIRHGLPCWRSEHGRWLYRQRGLGAITHREVDSIYWTVGGPC
jgi:hypothetical protein